MDNTMGSPHSKPEDRLRYISREVNALRSSLRQSRQNLSTDKKEAIIQSLAHQSSEVDLMRDKVKPRKIDNVMKEISQTMEEVLKIDPRESDMGRAESNSFDLMPVSKRENSVASLSSQKTTSIRKSLIQRNYRGSAPTIRDIEAKLDNLKPLIITALNNKDTVQLRVHYKTIHVLATELEMIHVEKDTPLENRKDGLLKKLTGWYQKLTKALRDIKKEENSQNNSTQKRKEEAFNELSEIELYVAENESLIDRMGKEKNTGEFGNIRNNVVKLSQRLSKVDIVDNDVKDKVVILSQKVTELVKNLDYTMTRKEFDSKFVQLLDSYQRTVKNFTGPSKAETTIKTLENLCASVENLEELNDSTKNKKAQLLTDINKQIKNIREDLTKESDSQTIQQIVEDNVVLRKKVKSTDREHTVIDQFFCHWDNVKSNFDINAYSNLSLLRIDSVLEEMQHSINDIRIGISNKCDTNPPTNLVRKRSQSVPRLNTKKNYGSRQSLDQLDSNQLIKAKAKVYNLSSSEKLSVKKPQENYANNRFSEINQIKMQVHYIKEKINENHNKNLLRQKLEKYLQGLTDYYNDSNKTVANNAIIVSNDITELLNTLDVADYKERVKILTKRVQNFNGTRYDKEYDEIKDDLLKCQVTLENLFIPNEFNLLRLDKNKLLEDVFYNIESLQGKATYLKNKESETVKHIKANLQALNDKVKRFSGTYKGVLYNQIERDLNKILLNIGEQTENKIHAEELTKEVERLLKILESRSSLAQSFKNSKYDGNKSDEVLGITKIKNDLNNIKTEIDKTPDDNVNAFIGLQSRLDLVNLEFSQISSKPNEQLEKEKDIFSNEIQTLKNVVDAKVALGQQPLVQWPEREMQADLVYPKNDINKEMEKLESKFQKIKNEVSGPNTEEDIYKCYKLAQDIKKLLETLNQYKFVRASDLFIRKTNLQSEMQHYLQLLEKEKKDTDYVIDIEKRVDSIENLLSSNRQSDIRAMAKELQAIQNKLGQHNVSAVNETLRERKTSIQQKTDYLVQKLIQMSDSEAENINKKLKEDLKKIVDIEEQTKVLRPEIFRFVGLQSDNKFYELDETTMRYILILDKIDSDNPELHRRKIKLLKELHQFGEILDDRAKQTQEVKNMEDQLNELSAIVNNFSGTEEELLQIRNKSQKTANMLQSLQVVKELAPRKNACVEAMSVLFNRVMTLEALKTQSDANSVEINPGSIPIKSSEFSSTTSLTETRVTKHRSLGLNTQVFNFTNSESNTATSNSATSSSTTSSNKTKYVVKLNDSKLLQIEKDIKQLELILNDTNDEKKLEEIDNAFTNYTMELANMNYPKECAEFRIKTKLFEKINNLTDTIEQKLQDNELMKNIKQEVNEIANKLNVPLRDDQINALDERLIKLLTTLGHVKTPSLKNEKDACMMQIMLYAKNISDYKNSVKNTAV